MRIDDFLYAPHYKRPDQGGRSKPDLRIPEGQSEAQSTSDAAVEDIVQLTLGHDGIWEVTAASPSDDPAMQTSQAFSEAFPRVSRLYHTLLRVYSPQGITQALEHSRGMLVDLYA